MGSRVLRVSGGSANLGRHHFLLLLATTLVFALAYFELMPDEGSDPRMGLMVSQNILKNRTFSLDPYKDALESLPEGYAGSFVVEVGGRLFYYFPMGAPIFSIPFVWLANLFGKDMTAIADEQELQNVVSAVLVAAVFVLLYRICRHYLDEPASLVIALVSVLGSTLMSTMGSALWNIDFAVLFITLSLLLVAGYDSGYSRGINPFLLGFFLFAAYISRPSTAVFVVVVLAYLAFVNRRLFLRTAAVAFALLVLFVGLSRVEYGQWLPPYYNEVGRFQIPRPPIWIALYGSLFSPSRGLLVFSPFIALVFVGAIWLFGRLRRQPLLWLTLGWFSLQLVLISRATRWWGGFSFGPRLLTELIPGLVLLTALVWREFCFDTGPKLQRIAVTVYVSLGVVGIFFNSYQGLFNLNTAWWNGTLAPSIDRRPDYLLDWRYPQFLANNQSICDRNREFSRKALANDLIALNLSPYEIGQRLTFESGKQNDLHDLEEWVDDYVTQTRSMGMVDDNAASRQFLPTFMNGPFPPDALFFGWAPPEAGVRSSMCRSAGFAFLLQHEVDVGQTYVMELTAGSLGPQKATVSVNGVRLGELSFPNPAEPPKTQTLLLPGTLLKPGQINEISFDVPSARIKGLRDRRLLGITFSAMKIYPQ